MTPAEQSDIVVYGAMVEAVAQAILPIYWVGPAADRMRDEGRTSALLEIQQGTRNAAIRAIKALRPCTAAMLEAGCHAHPEGDYHTGTTLIDIIKAEWEAMIDAALEP